MYKQQISRYQHYKQYRDFEQISLSSISSKSSKRNWNQSILSQDNNNNDNINKWVRNQSFDDQQYFSIQNFYQIGKQFTIYLQLIRIDKQDLIQNWKIIIFQDIKGLEVQCFVGNEVKYNQFKEKQWYELKNATLEYHNNQKQQYKINIKFGGSIRELQHSEFYNIKQVQKLEEINNTQIMQFKEQTYNLEKMKQFMQRFPEYPNQSSNNQEKYKYLYNILIIISTIYPDEIKFTKDNQQCTLSRITVIDKDNQSFDVQSWRNFSNIQLKVNQILFFEKLELKQFKNHDYLLFNNSFSKITTDENLLMLLPDYDDIQSTLALKLYKEQEEQQKKQAIVNNLFQESYIYDYFYI